MRSHEDDADYHKVPTLGKHYSQKWAMEDMIEEQKEGNETVTCYSNWILKYEDQFVLQTHSEQDSQLQIYETKRLTYVKPNILQITAASRSSKPLSQSFPSCPSYVMSTIPSRLLSPPTSLTVADLSGLGV